MDGEPKLEGSVLHSILRRKDQVNLGDAGGVSGVLGVPNGGTGVSSPGASGNLLTSNGSAWVSAALSIANTIAQGTNVTITGGGTASSPYVISASGGGGSSAWSSLTNPSGSLSLAMGGNTTTFTGTTTSGTFLFVNSTARAGGFTYPPSPVAVYGNHAYNDGSGTFGVHDATNPTLVVYIGYDSVAGFGYIQSVNQGNAFEPLILNPNGGNVSVGGISAPNATLQLDYPAALSGTYGTNANLWLGDADGTVGHKIQSGFGFHNMNITVPTNVFGAVYVTPLNGGSFNGGALDFVWAARPSASTFNTAPVETMRLTSAGSLGIGNPSPTYQLDVVGGDIGIGTVGGRLRLKSGSNASIGTGTLSSGTATVANTSVTATSIILLVDTGSSITNLGSLQVSSKTAGTGFTVQSSNILDASTFTYIIFEQY